MNPIGSACMVEKWKLLLDNMISEKKVYGVLGELLVSEKLFVKIKVLNGH